MKTIEQTRRELFEAWDSKTFQESDHEQDGDGGYQDNIVNQCWVAFNAALDAVVIRLPESREIIEEGGWLSDVVDADDCRAAIKSTSLGLKII